MKADLVDLLRDAPENSGGMVGMLCRAAAEEIERLRAAAAGADVGADLDDNERWRLAAKEARER